MNKYFINADSVIYRFDKNNKPALVCKLPANIIFQTIDCWNNQIKSEDQVLDKLNYDIMNPCTGPVYFEGVEPGDVLEISINRIDCHSPGSVLCLPDEGVMGDLVKKPITKIIHFDKNHVWNMGNGFSKQLVPMIGVIGVTPSDGNPQTMESGYYGGNMDTTLIKKDAKVFLPVQVEGGLLALGDLHANQGDGESFTTGVEVSGEVEITVRLRKDLKMDTPFVQVDGHLSSIISSEIVDKALHDCMEKFIRFIGDNGKLDFNNAGIMCGIFGNLAVCQLSDDPLRTTRMSMPLDILSFAGVNL